MSQRPICNSFHGNIKEIPEIGVDNFENIDRKAYFLSHYHADHIGGLFTEKFLNYIEKSSIPIYTSEITAEILLWASEHQKKTWIPKNCIKPLKLGKTLITIPPGRDGYEDLYLEVKLIPAGHCLGSVMYLFRVRGQTILFTGDFRINTNDITKYNQLHEGNNPLSIDVMYLDTTFQGICHDVFPKRSEIVDCAIEEIEQWLNQEDAGVTRFVALKTSALIGYEFVFKEIYKRLGLKIYVDEEKMLLYSKFKDISECLTADSENVKVHLCHWSSGWKGHDRCIPDANRGNYLTLRFSAKSWTNVNTSEKMIEKSKYDNRLEICFATHCSSSELAAFVNYFAPKRIVGFPRKYIPVCNNDKVANSNESFVLSPPKQVVAKSNDGFAKVPKSVVRSMFSD